MSNEATKTMIRAYEKESPATLFLTGQFQAPAENFYNSETVEMDIERDDEDLAIVITDLTTGVRMNAADLYTNKEYLAPIYGEGIALTSKDLLKRDVGRNPFENLNYRASIIARILKGARKVQKKILRAVELNAGQVLTTGTVTLIDSNGVALYEIDFQPKATHFPQVTTSWSAAGADPLTDLDSLGEVIRDDGKEDPDTLIMGKDAYRNFIANTKVQAHYDNRRIDQGIIAPMEMRGQGGKYRGIVEIGNYRYDIWTYGGRYKHPQTGTQTPYIPTNKVVMRSSTGRLDATFGNIPHIGRALGLAAPIIPGLPERISQSEGVMDIHPHAWLSPDGRQLFASASSRPLLIPTAIDTFGCLNTVAP
jgi:hypothetical protein